MITRLWPLTLLVTQIALGYDHEADLTRCNSETACFIRESCFDPGNNDLKVLKEYKAEKLKIDGKCDVVLQMKALTKTKLHVVMQVKPSGDKKLKAENGLILKQEENEFICMPNGITGSAKWDQKIIPVGKPIYNDQLLFCSFLAELKAKTDLLLLVFNGISASPKLIFNDEDKEVEVATPTGWNSYHLWMKAPETCNRDLVISLNKDPPTGILWTEVQTVFDDMKCSDDRPDPQFSVLKKGDKTPIETSKVICVVSERQWKYEVAGSAGPILENIVGEFQVFCSEKLCRKCNYKPDYLTCTACTTPDLKEDPKECPTLMCTNDKWTTTGTTIIDGKAECKRTTVPQNFTWVVGNTELPDKAACLEKLDCGALFKDKTTRNLQVDDSCDPDAPSNECLLEGLGTPTIRCKDGYKMKLKIDEKDEDAGEGKIECNTETGKYEKSGKEIHGVSCIGTEPPKGADPAAASTWDKIGLPVALAVVGILVVSVIAIAIFVLMKKKKKKKTAPASSTKTIESKVNSEKKTDKSAMKSATSNASTMSSVPGDAPDGSEKKKSSRKSKRDSKKSSKSKKEKFKLEDFETWDNEQFSKKILPNFGTVSAESKTKWLRNHMCRFYAYCNTKKTPESGTFTQYWLLVKRCMDDKCEDAGVWVELWHVAFTMAFSVVEKTQASDEFRLLLIKPFETYMLEYFKKCDLYKRKDEPRSETEMRVICIEILLHTRHPDVTEVLRTLTYNEKLECPLRMLTAACYTRERDEKPATVQIQYKRVLDTAVLDPHIAEGWGTYLQHCLFGLGAFLITSKEAYQYFLFEAVYQFPLQKDSTTERRFSPTDWLYVYKGALLHENSAKIALEMFKKMNDGCLLHIDVLLKKKHEDEKDREKTIEQYKRDMKEFTLLLADLLVGEEEFNEFKPHLRFVILFVGELAKTGEPLNEDRIRERAINMGNMARDRNFAKESVDCLKSIGAKMI